MSMLQNYGHLHVNISGAIVVAFLIFYKNLKLISNIWIDLLFKIIFPEGNIDNEEIESLFVFIDLIKHFIKIFQYYIYYI